MFAALKKIIAQMTVVVTILIAIRGIPVGQNNHYINDNAKLKANKNYTVTFKPETTGVYFLVAEDSSGKIGKIKFDLPVGKNETVNFEHTKYKKVVACRLIANKKYKWVITNNVATTAKLSIIYANDGASNYQRLNINYDSNLKDNNGAAVCKPYIWINALPRTKDETLVAKIHVSRKMKHIKQVYNYLKTIDDENLIRNNAQDSVKELVESGVSFAIGMALPESIALSVTASVLEMSGNFIFNLTHPDSSQTRIHSMMSTTFLEFITNLRGDSEPNYGYDIVIYCDSSGYHCAGTNDTCDSIGYQQQGFSVPSSFYGGVGSVGYFVVLDNDYKSRL